MKRILSMIAVAGVVVIVAEIIYSGIITPTHVPTRVNGPEILAAAHSYARDLTSHGQVVPAMVSLRDLIAKGLLKPQDLTGFSGMDASVSLTANASHPHDVLMWVRMQDGTQMVVLTDGSAHIARTNTVGGTNDLGFDHGEAGLGMRKRALWFWGTNDLGLKHGEVGLDSDTVKINMIP
jgi:hypothetical protein